MNTLYWAKHSNWINSCNIIALHAYLLVIYSKKILIGDAFEIKEQWKVLISCCSVRETQLNFNLHFYLQVVWFFIEVTTITSILRSYLLSKNGKKLDTTTWEFKLILHVREKCASIGSQLTNNVEKEKTNKINAISVNKCQGNFSLKLSWIALHWTFWQIHNAQC